MNIGENIYKFRIRKNMSQGDLADALEVSRQSVSKWENNSAVPELDKLIKMAQIFEITIDELVTGAQQEQAASTQEPALPVIPERFPGRKIAGAICLCCGLILIIVCIFLVILMGNRYEEDLVILALLIGAPLTITGAILLMLGKNAAYWVCTVLYLLSSGAVPVLYGGFSGIDTRVGIITVALIAAGIALGIWTVVKLRREQLNPGAAALVILLMLAVIGVLGIGMLPPESVVKDIDIVMPSQMP